jgi:hypothetical protein
MMSDRKGGGTIMADTQAGAPEASESAGKLYGPGVLMVFGLACLVVAAWCGSDLYRAYFQEASEQAKTWGTTTLLFNWGGVVAFVLGAVYAFVLAGKRWKKAAAEPGDEGGANKPPDPGA